LWIYNRSRNLPAPVSQVSLPAATALILSLGCWLIAYKAASVIGQQIPIPIILWCAIWMSCGLETARRLAAPVFCLYFAIPIWDFALPGLQTATVAVSESALRLLGVPVQLNGTLVRIPEGTFQIAAGCAGKRYLIVTLTIAALLAGTTHMRASRAIA